MLSTDQINDLHRLYWSERWAIRKIERYLKISWKTIRKYLPAPAQASALRSRSSKLDPFQGQIAEWLEKDPRVTAAVIDSACVLSAITVATAFCRSMSAKYVRNQQPAAPSCA